MKKYNIYMSNDWTKFECGKYLMDTYDLTNPENWCNYKSEATAYTRKEAKEIKKEIEEAFSDCGRLFVDIEEHETFDVEFNNDDHSAQKGFAESYEYCKNYIDTYNGTDESYFADFKGGQVAIRSNLDGEYYYGQDIV